MTAQNTIDLITENVLLKRRLFAAAGGDVPLSNHLKNLRTALGISEHEAIEDYDVVDRACRAIKDLQNTAAELRNKLDGVTGETKKLSRSGISITLFQ